MHLRRLYSWLVFVQAALLLAAVANTDRTLDAAIDQARSLVRVSQSWDQQWISNKARTQFEGVRASFQSGWPDTVDRFKRFELKIEGAPEGIIKAPLSVMSFSEAWTLNGEKGIFVPGVSDKVVPLMGFQAALFLEPPQTVQNFERLWNALNAETFINVMAVPENPIPARLFSVARPDARSYAVRVSFENVSSDSGDPPAAARPFWASLGPPTNEGKLSFEGRFRAPPTVRGQHNARLNPATSKVDHVLFVHVGSGGPVPRQADYSASAWGADTRLEIPLLTYRIPFPVRNDLRDLVDPAMTTGQFSRAFAELDEHVEGLKQLPLEAVKSFLEQKRRKADRSVQIFGLSFPANSLSLWGAAFLCLIQIYFFLSLRTLSMHLEHGDFQFPWIAFYRDGLARAAFVLTAFVSPTVVISAIGRANFWPTVEWDGALAFAPVWALSLAAAIAACRVYFRRIVAARPESAAGTDGG